MTQHLLRERAKRWDRLHDRLFVGMKWGIACSMLVAILGIVVGATFAAVMNVTQGANIQEEDYVPIATILFLFDVCVSAVLGFSAQVAGICAIVLSRRIGKTSLRCSVNVFLFHVVALAITGYTAGASAYFAIVMIIDWLKQHA